MTEEIQPIPMNTATKRTAAEPVVPNTGTSLAEILAKRATPFYAKMTFPSIVDAEGKRIPFVFRIPPATVIADFAVQGERERVSVVTTAARLFAYCLVDDTNLFTNETLNMACTDKRGFDLLQKPETIIGRVFRAPEIMSWFNAIGELAGYSPENETPDEFEVKVIKN